MTEIYFRCDADATLGYGHLSRCLTLADEARRRGCKAIFLLRDQDVQAQNEVARQQFKVIPVCNDDTLFELVETWPTHTPVVLDLAHREAMARKGYLDNLIQRLRHRSQKIILIDSMGEDAAAVRISEQVDMVISPYLGAETGQPPLACTWLAGAKYVILPQAFQSPLKPRPIQPKKTLLVTMGGADPWFLTERMLSSLSILNDTRWSVTVVAGLFFSKDRTKALRSKFPWARIVQGRRDLIEDYCASDAVVSAAGLTRYEIATLGLPGLLISPTEFCRDYLTNFRRMGLAEVLFAQDPEFSTQLQDALQSLLSHLGPTNPPRMIDGFGCSRVIDAILEMKPACGASADAFNP